MESILTRFGFRLTGPTGYAVAALVALIAIGLRLLLPDQVPPFIFFFLAAGVSSFAAGIGPGLVTVALCALVSWYVLLPEYYSFRLTDFWLAFSLALYTLLATIECWLISLLRDLIMRTQASAAALRESEGRLTAAVEAAGLAPWYVDVATGSGRWSDDLSRLVGLPAEKTEISAAEWRQFLHPDDRDRVLEAFRATAEGRASYNVEYRIVRTDGAIRWFASRGDVVREPDGKPSRVVGVVMDITERKTTDERQKLLMREVDHRAKNLLAVVQSILQLTRAEDIGTFVALVNGRVQALARVHSLLSASRWGGADLGRLVAEELAAYRTEKTRISSSGPPVILQPAAAQSLALALHELATNAAKYGALSQSKGRVAVAWALSEDGLTVTWTELRGPAVATPERHGFGSTVMRSGIEQQLSGRVEFDWRPQGLQATLWLPRHHVSAAAPTASEDMPAVVPPLEGDSRSDLSGKRVLVVEDEALIGMMIEAALTDAGAAVVGPATKLAEALAIVQKEPLDAAVLDGNLGGVSSEPVAWLLRERGIPFVVATGYSEAGLPPEFASMPRLAKPFAPEHLVTLVGSMVDG